MKASLVSRLEVGGIRWWRNLWALRWGKEMPNRLLADGIDMGIVKPIWYQLREDLWMKLDARDLVQETIMLEGTWERNTTAYIGTTLQPGDVFLDIGANAGYFTLLASYWVRAGGKVLAVEPNPPMAIQLRENVARSGLTNVLIEEGACSETTGVRSLFVGNSYTRGNASFYKNPRNDRPPAGKSASIDVRCTPVDELCDKYRLPRVDLLKLDVEGAELEVLRGMSATLTRWRPRIVVEIFPAAVDSVTAYISQFGYTVSSLGEHSNFLCSPAA
jgi:FkbM family methyltransferase